MARGAFYAGDRTFRVGDSPRVAPSEGEATVDIAYCGVCGTDLHIYLGHMDARVAMPQVIGHEMSGVHLAAAPVHVSHAHAALRHVHRTLAPGPRPSGATAASARPVARVARATPPAVSPFAVAVAACRLV